MELQWTSGPLSEVIASVVLTQKWSHIYLDVCHSNSTCIVTNASSHYLDVFGPKLNHSNYEFALCRTPWFQIFAWLWKVTYVSKFLHFFLICTCSIGRCHTCHKALNLSGIYFMYMTSKSHYYRLNFENNYHNHIYHACHIHQIYHNRCQQPFWNLFSYKIFDKKYKFSLKSTVKEWVFNKGLVTLHCILEFIIGWDGWPFWSGILYHFNQVFTRCDAWCFVNTWDPVHGSAWCVTVHLSVHFPEWIFFQKHQFQKNLTWSHHILSCSLI